jgi:predicted esterase
MSMRTGLSSFVALLVLLGTACECTVPRGKPVGSSSKEAATVSTDRRTARPSSEVSNEGSGPVRVEPLEGSDPPVFVVRGRDLGSAKLVFLHGMCGHGLGYAQSFQHASASKGTLIAPQADLVCGDGPGAKWSLGVTSLDARITAAFRQLGHQEPIDDICVLGMSQGATRAASLVRTFPERYTRLISMGAPTAVQTRGLERLRAAVLMVGERERKDLMLASERELTKKGVPATSLIIPDADHAAMGPTPEQTMATALDWLWQNSRPIAEAP